MAAITFCSRQHLLMKLLIIGTTILGMEARIGSKQGFLTAVGFSKCCVCNTNLLNAEYSVREWLGDGRTKSDLFQLRKAAKKFSEIRKKLEPFEQCVVDTHTTSMTTKKGETCAQACTEAQPFPGWDDAPWAPPQKDYKKIFGKCAQKFPGKKSCNNFRDQIGVDQIINLYYQKKADMKREIKARREAILEARRKAREIEEMQTPSFAHIHSQVI